MTPNEYQQAALRTDGNWDFYAKAHVRLASADPDMMMLLHAAVGIASEAGELQDALKKHIFYGREFDWTNAVEEVGDLLWYAALACEALGTTMEYVMEFNIAKLKVRYPEKFEAQRSIERDLAAERAALEGK